MKKNILAENMHRFGTKNLNEDDDQNNNGYPDHNETNKTTIVHTNANGDRESIELDLTQFNDFLLSLSPIIGRRYEVTPKTQKDVIEYIVKYLGGYGAMGGGRIDIQ